MAFKGRVISLKYDGLRLVCALYAAVPTGIFLWGWLKWYLSVPLLLLLGTALWRLRSRRAAAVEADALELSLYAAAALALLALAWSFFAGQGGYWYQTSDHSNRNAVLHDLISHNWPVYYSDELSLNGGRPFALTYYICHWLLPALGGKLILLLGGSVRLAWAAARLALFLWTSAGLWLLFLLLAVTLRPCTGKQALAAAAGLIAFSGLDAAGAALYGQPITLRIEWWAGAYQFSSLTTDLFWVYNQALTPWLMTVCVLNERSAENLALLGLLALPFGPLPFVGLAALCIAMGIGRAIPAIRHRRLGALLREIASPPKFIGSAGHLPRVHAVLLRKLCHKLRRRQCPELLPHRDPRRSHRPPFSAPYYLLASGIRALPSAHPPG